MPKADTGGLQDFYFVHRWDYISVRESGAARNQSLLHIVLLSSMKSVETRTKSCHSTTDRSGKIETSKCLEIIP